MKYRSLAHFILVFLFTAPFAKADLPDETYILRTKDGKQLEVLKWLRSEQKLESKIPLMQLNGRTLSRKFAVLPDGLVFIDNGGKATLISEDPALSGSSIRISPDRAHDVIESDPGVAWFASDGNKIESVTAKWHMETVLAPNEIDPGSWGQIKFIRKTGPTEFLAITATGNVLRLEPRSQAPGKVTIKDVFRIPIFHSDGPIRDVMATKDGLWVETRDSGARSSIIRFHDLQRSGLLPQEVKLNGELVQLLEVDPVTRDLTYSDGSNIMLASKSITDGPPKKIGSIATLQKHFAPDGFLLNYPNRVLDWWDGRGKKYAEAVKLEKTAHLNPQKILNPVTTLDFINLFTKELPGLPESVTVEVFANWVNTTNTLKYYFKELSESELKLLGLRRQMDWLRPIAGEENSSIEKTAVASILADGQAREMALQRLRCHGK